MAYATFKLGSAELQDMRHLADHSGHILKPGLTVDIAPKNVDGLQIELIPPAKIRSDQPALFRIRIGQSSNGTGVHDLQAILAPAAQVLIVHENGHHIMHLYAQRATPGRHARHAGTHPPFRTEPGLYSDLHPVIIMAKAPGSTYLPAIQHIFPWTIPIPP